MGVKQRVLPVVLALTFAVPAAAQTTQDNSTKYTQLRKRLLTDFVFVGDEPGASQPAQERNDALGSIRWADSTIVLGFYIGILATEYAMLSEPSNYPGFHGSGGTAAATSTELYYALRAMERLDEVADASFPPPCSQTPAKNGFFIRDDVPASFYSHFPPLTAVQSDFIDPVLTNKEMSQDQVYHVLGGLALVKRFVPASVTVQGKALSPWAVEQAQRIGELVSANDWVIKNPACDREVERGPLASGFSGGTRLALGFITDGAFVPDTSDVLIGLWDSFKSPSSVPYLDSDSVHMAMVIAAVGNGWGDTTAEALADLMKLHDWPLYPLMHRALHGDTAVGWCTTASKVNERARLMLDELPMGGEPAHPPAGQSAVHGFTSTNRFIRGKSSAYTGGDDAPGLRYSGVDYLLLHNLYALATPATWSGGSGPGIPQCTAPGSDAGTPSPDGGPAAQGDGDSSESGCGCRLGSKPKPVRGWALALALAAAALRRRR